MHRGDETSSLQGLDYLDNRTVKGVVCTHRFFFRDCRVFQSLHANGFGFPLAREKTLHLAHDRDCLCPLELFSKF